MPHRCQVASRRMRRREASGSEAVTPRAGWRVQDSGTATQQKEGKLVEMTGPWSGTPVVMPHSAALATEATVGVRVNQPIGPSDLVGAGHSNHSRSASASRLRFCPEAREVRYQDRDPRLRFRWRRDVIGLRLRSDGSRHGIATG